MSSTGESTCLTPSAGRNTRALHVIVLVAAGLLGYCWTAEAFTFEDYVNELTDTHPAFMEFDSRLTVARRQAEEAQPDYRRFRHSLEPAYSFAGENQAAQWNAEARHDAELEASTTRELSSGGQITLSAQSKASRLRGQQSFELPGMTAEKEDQEEYTFSLGVGFSQPLIRNIGDKRGRLPAAKAAFGPVIAEHAVRRHEEELLQQATELFIRWAEAAARVETWQQQLEVAENRIDYVGELVEADLRDEVDLLRAETQRSRTQADLERVTARRESLRARVAASIGRMPADLPARPDINLLDTASLLGGGGEADGTEGEQTSRILQAPDATEKELAVRIQQLETERSIRAELTGPEAFLDMDVEMLARDEDPLDALDSPTAAVRIGGRVELDTGTADERRLARIDAEIGELEDRIARRRHERSARYAESTTLLRRSARLMERYREVQAGAEELAHREQNRYRRGLATVSEVLESEQAVYEAQRGLYDAAGQYHLAAVATAAWSGSLLEALPR